jgi:hypothetical protein
VRGLGDLALEADIQAARRAGGRPVVRAVEFEDLGAHPADAGQSQVEAGTGADGSVGRLDDLEHLGVPLGLAPGVGAVVEDGVCTGRDVDRVLDHP